MISNWEKAYNKSNRNGQLFSLRRLNNPETTNPCDPVPENNVQYRKHHYDKYMVDGKRVLSKMPLSIFQEHVVGHFDIGFKKLILYGQVERRHLQLFKNQVGIC